jgi:hypothetical protein
MLRSRSKSKPREGESCERELRRRTAIFSEAGNEICGLAGGVGRLVSGLPDFFQTKNTSLGKFWRVLQWKMLVYFMAN